MSDVPRVCANCKWWTMNSNAGMGICHFELVDIRKNFEDFCSHFEVFPAEIREPNFELKCPPFQEVG